MKEYKVINYKGFKINIYNDFDCESPRVDRCNSTIFSNHRSYNPDGHKLSEIADNPYYQNSDFYIDTKKFSTDYIWLRVYAYIHSGISISCNHGYPYNDRFDSGLFGIIAIPIEKVKEENSWLKITKKRRTLIESCLEAEIKVLDDYYSGSVYYFTVTSESGEELDSCGGFFGDSSLIEIESQCKAFIDNLMRASA